MIATPLDKKELDIFFGNKEKDIIMYFLFKAAFSQPEATSKQNLLSIILLL